MYIYVYIIYLHALNSSTVAWKGGEVVSLLGDRESRVGLEAGERSHGLSGGSTADSGYCRGDRGHFSNFTLRLPFANSVTQNSFRSSIYNSCK